MSNVNDSCQLLQTRKNGVDYTISRRNDFESTGACDDSIITFCISALESMQRLHSTDYPPHAAFPLIAHRFATDGTYDCVQIMAQKDQCPTPGFLCWAEDGIIVTGTAIIRMRSEAYPFKRSLTVYGNFRETMRGSIPPDFHLPTQAHNLVIVQFSMMSERMKEQSAQFWNDSIEELAI